MSDNTVSPAAETPAAKTPRRWPALLVGLILVAGVAAGLGWFMHKPKTPPAELASDKLGMSRPDGLLETHSLSQLPKDLLAVPFLKETLTEDFVFYYEAHADRLGLIGSLRRIIYEHDLKLQDSLIEQLFDQPADVALWRGADGRLKDFLLVMDRGGLAKLLEPLAKVALDDSQLTTVATVKVGTDDVTLYQLTYNASKALLFASHGDKLVVLSNPTKLYDSEGGASEEPGSVSTQSIAALLNGDKLFPEAFGLPPRAREVKQRLSVNASVLAMGYQRFIPNFAGLRFDMDDKGWHSFLAMDELDNQPDFDFKPIWQAMPMGASACVALPLAAEQQKPLLVKLGAEESVAQALTEHMAGAAGLCWYADSRLYTPLLVASLNDDDSAKLDGDLGNLFGSMVGAYEGNVEEHAFPVVEKQEGQSHQWQRQVSSNFGPYKAKDAENPEAITGKAFMKVSLARHGSTLLFSLDDKLVDKALGTLDKRFPPMADVVPKDLLMPVYFGPESMAQLMQQETLDSLPQDMEPVFYNAAQTYLIPKLRKLGGYGKYALTLPEGSEPDGHWQWLPLEWKAL
ncbi:MULTISPECIES: DUF2138 domain-containing protein [unclassified Pseudomonas]|uniref:DUF2138 domain-containing protein n=1 Tax=unclassified Pseudomonas TaxID=196821 RepID=UPI000C86A6FD|nr:MULTISPECIES: DUF2138 domain-containing protein [unclassified Pseudomonas]PMV85643.1 DUF2138 domain-containing protein [Pseudomonas sp. GW101-1A09]PMV90788.1 DUF2138 domain-containing protein [Pseudomonas sp. FW306-2-2C-B10A]PMV96037.1 DUF2138 domain-containing protein [Pseudomonas sp. GW460-C8]PMW00145.1 DUF2138 domain-containing protein [Pseudomonas sp. MPR-TSA4]PMW19059.1 DUF2138 domain-containing protein [Pseudomonas sp. GW456-11-11-14-TSB2]